ncbi:class I SAM-dependent methyltransferase [Nocardioides sp.]|uniref:class I SAM-dependent methyltransferase n=1 Tax=Nocardioides sp. TaxID=35761 RepID=UPI002B2650B4|nr:class I SAM-dependent methyltransferase [Nocardioides sp.]
MSVALPGAIPSPNIWKHTATYEVENRAVDPDGRLWSALNDRVSWAGRTVLDLGCGTGFHLPAFASSAAAVIGVEPHPDLLALARRRVRGLPNVTLLPGTAQQVPLPEASVDVVHVRWAYFFGPGCEPGLAELDRVVRRGGTALVIDNDGSRSTFGRWFRQGYPHLPAPSEIERFWTTRGWTRTPVDMGWRFESRADLEAVVRIEFAPAMADRILAEHTGDTDRRGDDGLEVDYAVNVWSRDF